MLLFGFIMATGDLRSLPSTIHTDDSNIYTRSTRSNLSGGPGFGGGSGSGGGGGNDSSSSLLVPGGVVDGVPFSRVRQLEHQLFEKERAMVQLQQLLDEFVAVAAPTSNGGEERVDGGLDPEHQQQQQKILQEKYVVLTRQLEERNLKRDELLSNKMNDESYKSQQTQQTQEAQDQLLKSQQDLIAELKEALEYQVQTVVPALQEENRRLKQEKEKAETAAAASSGWGPRSKSVTAAGAGGGGRSTRPTTNGDQRTPVREKKNKEKRGAEFFFRFSLHQSSSLIFHLVFFILFLPLFFWLLIIWY